MKKILLLGGSPQQIVAIKTAKRLGLYTVLCDYLPDNPGKVFADKFYQESTTDKEKILEIAKAEGVSGVAAYATDPAAPTAAYVAEKLGLAGNPTESAEILCNKDMFRRFLRENGFAVPRAEGFSDREQALAYLNNASYPVIIKPVDSSGSKGVTVLRSAESAKTAIDTAFEFSRAGRIVAEEFVEKNHRYLVGGDIFVSNGEVIMWGLLNCHRDGAVNRLVPVGKSYPLAINRADEEKIRGVLSEIVKRLGIKNGAMNVELIVAENGEVYPIDIGPRNGGNMIPDLLGRIFGVDVVEMTIRAAMGEEVGTDIADKPQCFMATHNLHADKNGIFEGITYSEEIKRVIIRQEIYKEKGERVEFFDNAAKAIGIVFMEFKSKEEMESILENINNHIRVRVRGEQNI